MNARIRMFIVVIVTGSGFAGPVVDPAAAQETKLQGQILHANGAPAVGVTVARFWGADGAYKGIVTDERGQFSLVMATGERPVLVLAMNADRKMGAIGVYEVGAYDQKLSLTLEPLVHVRGSITCEELGGPPEWTSAALSRMPGNLKFAVSSSWDAEFEFYAPAGEYEIYFHGSDFQSRAVRRTLKGNEGTVDFGELDMKATKIATMYGREAPSWTVTEARGVRKEVQLADLRGKFILLEIWGYW